MLILVVAAFVFGAHAEPKPQSVSGQLLNILQHIHTKNKTHIKIEIDTESEKDVTTQVDHGKVTQKDDTDNDQITYLNFDNLPANLLPILGDQKNDFATFGKKFAKRILTKESVAVAKNFASNNAYLRELKGKGLNFKVGMHPYMDLDEEQTYEILIPLDEFSKRTKRNERALGLGSASIEEEETESRQREERSPLPASFDWRDQDLVPPVRNQGRCASCWAFSAAACLEIQYSRKWPDYEFIDLSEQEMSCVYPNKRTICKGGFPTNAFYHYMRGKGIGFEEDWPYNPYGDQTCYTFKPKVKVTSVRSLLPFGMDKLKRAIINDGPVAVGIYINWDFMYYKGGVFDVDCDVNTNLGGHAMVIIGYGTEGGWPYWIVRNSWGKNWGEDGYIRIWAGQNLCGMESRYLDQAQIDWVY